ncbi:hypothetical protein BH23ACT11_BH23ACT11_11780 [soil metagenome]
MVPEAVYSGQLVLDNDGCLRVDSKHSQKYVLIWTPGYTVKSEGPNIRILNEKNRVVAETGNKIRVGGGEIPGLSLDGIAFLSERLQQELPRRCAGPYWLVGEIMDPERPG